MSKNIVAVFCGGRGSGKTLSMSTEGAFRMIAGHKCFSNYPIGFNYRQDDGTITQFDSIIIEIEDLIRFREDIRGGCILLDELNLWVSSRGSMTNINKLFNAWIQLIRKRDLSLFITAQSFDSLDKFVRWQCDMYIQCLDLSFRYPNLKEGSFISQLLTDVSGYFTGRPLFRVDKMDEWARNTRTRILAGRRFWGVYNSWSEVDILKAMTRYEVKKETRIIERDGRIDDGGIQGSLEENVKAFAEYCRYTYPEGKHFTTEELRAELAEFKVEGDQRVLGKLLKAAGFEYKQGRKGNSYEIV